MISTLHIQGLKTIDVLRDGNCLFSAVALHSLKYSNNNNLRHDTCQFILHHPDLFQNLFDNSNNFLSEIHKLQKPGHFNSGIGDLVVTAISKLLGRRVIVLTPHIPLQHTIFYPSNNHLTGPDITILLHNEHYSAIFPTSRQTDIVAAPDLYNNTISTVHFIHFKSTPSNQNAHTAPTSNSISTSDLALPATPTMETSSQTHAVESDPKSPPKFKISCQAVSDPAKPTTCTHFDSSVTCTRPEQDQAYESSSSHPIDGSPIYNSQDVSSFPSSFTWISPTSSFLLDTSTSDPEILASQFPQFISQSTPPNKDTSTAHIIAPDDINYAQTHTYDPSLDDSSILFHFNDKVSNDDFLDYLPRNFHIPLDKKCSKLFNQFRKLQDKFILSVLHLSTLLIYHQYNFVPRGLILNCNPQALISENFDKTLLLFWKSTLHDSSILLLGHLINHYQTHLLRITPILNNIFKQLLSNLDPLSLRSVLARLKRYALRSWRSTMREKNRKLYLDLNIYNNLKFSDTLLSVLYQNPNHNARQFSKTLPFRTCINHRCLSSNSQIKKKILKRTPRNRRFIKNSIYRESQANQNREILNRTDIVNLSDYQLNEDETTVLSKNLQFCPTPNNFNPVALSCDLFKFARQLRLKEYHFDNEKENDYDEDDIANHPKLKKPNHSTPTAGRDKHLDTFIEGVTTEIMQTTRKPFYSNLNDSHQVALNSLKNNKDITIKPADKGGAIVIQNTKDYINECNRQLEDKKFYKQIDHDPTNKYNNTIKNTLRKAVKNNDINEEFSQQLIEKNPKAARFYTVPKIHKPNNPGRPIISGNGCPTEKISVFVDSFLQPLAMKLDSYVQDDIDFLRQIDDINNNNLITEDTLLCTMDVSALYTNIPHSDGTDACRQFLDTRQDKTTSTTFLCTLITLILTMNNFVFDGINFLQTQGTAMGTCMAPNYANLFMGSLESNFLNSCKIKPTKWLRYIDDIFILWNEGREKLTEFISAANNFHPSIKFTYEISDKIINFLDLTIHKTDKNRLETDLYSKPTNAHLYLHYSSCHPRHTKNSLPFSLAYRLLRICSTDSFLTKRLNELRQFLINRQYKPKTIDTAFNKIRTLTRSDSLKRKDKKKHNKRVPFVTTFHPGLPNIPHILRKYMPILHTSKRCLAAIPECPIVSYRRPKNLRDILVHAKLSSLKRNGFHTCSDKRCLTCPSALTGDTVPITSTSGIFKITKHLTCKSYNVIYVITCKRCKKQYVGKTETTLNLRVNNHRSFINTKKPDPLAKHFYTNNHTFADFQITAIDFVPHADTHTLCNKETFYIKLFKTVQPSGINSHGQEIYPIAHY